MRSGGIVDLWLPIFGANGNLDLSRHLVGDAVKRERRDEADDSLGYSLCRFGQAVIALDNGVRELVEPAAEPGDEAGPLQPGDRGGRDARLPDLGQPGHAMFSQECDQPFALRAGLGRFFSSDRDLIHPRICIIPGGPLKLRYEGNSQLLVRRVGTDTAAKFGAGANNRVPAILWSTARTSDR